MRKIMGDPAIPQAQKMQYIGAWQKAKQSGVLPTAAADAIRPDMTLRDILLAMERKAEQAMQDGTMWPKWGKAISGLASRKFWVVPTDQTPSCDTIPPDGGEPVDVRHMARLEIPLA